MRRQPNADTNEFIQFCKEKSWSWEDIGRYLQDATSQNKIIDLYCFVPDATSDALCTYSLFQPDDRYQNGKLLLEKLMDNLTPRQQLDAVLHYSCSRTEIWRLFCDGTSQFVEGGWFGFVAFRPPY